MQAALQVLARLLHYPQAELFRHSVAMTAILSAEPPLQPWQDELAVYVQACRDRDLLDLQAEHVASFDRGRQCALYLFEHRFGDSRERGPAMVELRQLYRSAGLDIVGRELPDYLPLYLEYCASLDPAAALAALAAIVDVLGAIERGLASRHSRYRLILQALLSLAGARPEADTVAMDRDDDGVAIDRAWAEVPVEFMGADPGACRTDRAQAVRWCASTPVEENRRERT